MGKPRGHNPELESDAERYAAGGMGDEEARQFEVRMLESPTVALEVDAAHRIRAGFRELQARGELESFLSRSRARGSGLVLAATMIGLLIGAALALHSSYRVPTIVANVARGPSGESTPGGLRGSKVTRRPGTAVVRPPGSAAARPAR
jgi:hypothetical protein